MSKSSSNWIAYAASIGTITLFLLLGLHVQRGINKQATVRSRDLSTSLARNINFTVNATISKYWSKLNMATIYAQSSSDLTATQHLLACYQKMDSTITKIWIVKKSSSALKTPASKIKPDNQQVDATFQWSQTGTPLLVLSTEAKLNNGSPIQMGIEINLIKLHNQISENREIREGYFTLTDSKGHFIYHPNEKLIGRKDNENVDHSKLMQAMRGWLKNDRARSSYLELNVQRYFFPQTFKNGKLLTTVYMLEFQYEEFIYKTTKNIWLLVGLPCLLIITILVIFMHQWRLSFIRGEKAEKELLQLSLINERQAKEMATAQLENLKGGVNPHFLFNSLGNLVALIKKEPAEAISFARSLSNLYRYLLDNENKDCVAIAQELTFAQEYYKIQKIRFGDQIEMHLNDTPPLYGKVPPLAIQILVENAIKHNSGTRDYPIVISIEFKDGYVVVSNTLNRKGSSGESSGKGQNNLACRYYYMTDKPCRFYVREEQYVAEIPII